MNPAEENQVTLEKNVTNLIHIRSHVFQCIQTFWYHVQSLILWECQKELKKDLCSKIAEYHYLWSYSIKHPFQKEISWKSKKCTNIWLTCLIFRISNSCLNWLDSSVCWKYSSSNRPSIIVIKHKKGKNDNQLILSLINHISTLKKESHLMKNLKTELKGNLSQTWFQHEMRKLTNL